MESCVISGNYPTATDNQPAININAGAVFTAENLEVTGNLSDTIISVKGQASIMNMTLAGNHKAAGTGYGNLNFVPSGDTRITNSILWNSPLNTLPSNVHITWSDLPSPVSGQGNISLDPLFAAGSYKLTGGSPCVDTGDPATQSPPPFDLDGKVRIWDGHGSGTAIIDMGAYEYGAPFRIDIGADQAVCQGNTVTLDAGAGYTSYNWDNGLGNQQYYTTGAEGLHTVTVVFPNGDTGLGTMHLTVHPLPVPDLGGDKSACQGETVTLCAEPEFAAYHWSNGASTRSIQVSAGGQWWITVQDGSTGCWSAQKYVNVVFHTLPSITMPADTTVCAGTSVTLIPVYSGVQTFVWSPGGQTTPTITVDSTGIGIGSRTYKLVVRSEWSCGDSGEVRVTFKQCTGMDDNVMSQLMVFPNPSDGVFTVQCKAETGECNLTVTDITGKTLYRRIVPGDQAGLGTNIDLRGNAPGIYILELSGKKGRYYRKVIVE
jgi:hypothetical protein